jgi:hypothetical protein
MPNKPPWQRGRAVTLPLPENTPQRFVAPSERDLMRQLKVIEVIQIEVGRISRNYEHDGVEQIVLTGIQKYLTILHKRYREDI